MNNYMIGIVDEDIEDIQFIERTIFINKPENINDNMIEFKEYSLSNQAKGLSDKVVLNVIEDITNNVIQALIVDYKIIVSATLVEGTEIFKRLSEIVPKFPVIILSNVPNDCYKKDFVDADKVYSKGDFFKIEEKYSKEKTLNIFRNMDNYILIRAKLFTQLNEHLSKLESDGYSEELLKAIISTENSLDDFCPQEQTEIEKSLNVSDLKEAVSLLGKAKEILGGNDED